jgi:hypothetical protein
MRGCLVCGVALIFASFAGAQFPPPRTPAPFTPPLKIQRLPEPARPQPPFTPPGSVPMPPSAAADGAVVQAGRVETPLPQRENKLELDPAAVTVKKVNGMWQVWAGQHPLRNLGADETGAKDIARLLHEQHPTEWIAIGSPRPIVEYGLVNGRPAITAGFPRAVVPIDLRSVRIEPIKGVWCLKDDGNILFNFGLNKADAEQALAVVRKYGFNRIGMLGDATNPSLTYFFVALESDGAKPPVKNPLILALQEQGLARTGIPVPGVGYMGEMVKLDLRKLDVRREGADWIVSAGEPIANFGHDQAAARDAQRLLQDGQFTEFCKAGPPGVSFFLANGQPPARVPLYVQGRRFDPAGLRVGESNGKWTVTDRGRHLFDVTSSDEGEAVLRLVKHYGFNQVCVVGSSPRANLTFLAKAR